MNTLNFTDAEKIVLLSALALDLTTTQETVKRNPSVIDVAEKRLAVINSMVEKITASVRSS